MIYAETLSSVKKSLFDFDDNSVIYKNNIPKQRGFGESRQTFPYTHKNRRLSSSIACCMSNIDNEMESESTTLNNMVFLSDYVFNTKRAEYREYDPKEDITTNRKSRAKTSNANYVTNSNDLSELNARTPKEVKTENQYLGSKEQIEDQIGAEFSIYLDVQKSLIDLKFDQINNWILESSPNQNNIELCLALLRSSFMIKEKLSNWGDLVSQLFFLILRSSGKENALKKMVGMIDKEQIIGTTS